MERRKGRAVNGRACPCLVTEDKTREACCATVRQTVSPLPHVDEEESARLELYRIALQHEYRLHTGYEYGYEYLYRILVYITVLTVCRKSYPVEYV